MNINANTKNKERMLSYKGYVLKSSLALITFSLMACSSSDINSSTTVVQERYAPADPGAVEFVWEAPMVDVIDVPPGLDPEGIYYRPAHQSIVEIRQGRWKYYGKGNK